MRTTLCGLSVASIILAMAMATAPASAAVNTGPFVAPKGDVHLAQAQWRGRAFRELDDDDIEDYLRDRGYYDVDVDEGRRGFRATACRDRAFYRFRVSYDGEVVDRERLGRCDARERVHVDVPGVELDVDRGVRLRVPGVRLRIP